MRNKKVILYNFTTIKYYVISSLKKRFFFFATVSSLKSRRNTQQIMTDCPTVNVLNQQKRHTKVFYEVKTLEVVLE